MASFRRTARAQFRASLRQEKSLVRGQSFEGRQRVGRLTDGAAHRDRHRESGDGVVQERDRRRPTRRVPASGRPLALGLASCTTIAASPARAVNERDTRSGSKRPARCASTELPVTSTADAKAPRNASSAASGSPGVRAHTAAAGQFVTGVPTVRDGSRKRGADVDAAADEGEVMGAGLTLPGPCPLSIARAINAPTTRTAAPPASARCRRPRSCRGCGSSSSDGDDTGSA